VEIRLAVSARIMFDAAKASVVQRAEKAHFVNDIYFARLRGG